jgi:hypothetical protein
MLMVSHLIGFGAGSGQAPLVLAGTSTVTDSGDINGAGNITAVAATRAYVAVGYASSFEPSINSVTLDGHACTLLAGTDTSAGVGNSVGAAIYGVEASFSAGAVNLVVDMSTTSEVTDAAVFFFTGGDTSDQVGATATDADVNDGSASSTSITPELDTSYLLCVAATGNNITLSATPAAGVTEVLDNTGAVDTGFGNVFAGYRLTASLGAKTMGCTAGTQESAIAVIEVR